MATKASEITGPDTICAIASPPGSGAIAMIRISGPLSLIICEKIFSPSKKGLKISQAKTHTIHFGTIGEASYLLDEVLMYIYKSPHSYTGEDAVEISCHGSLFIQQKIIELLLRHGCRLARPGEFTLRAYLNGKFDLSQAEAVADLIAANSQAAHDLALNQMRGGFSAKIKELRGNLIEFTSLLELELDFSEEDVEFADRKQLVELLSSLKEEITRLIDSFSVGNVLKTGIPVAIIGKTNVGKSTLLNAILNEERAIVSEIPGTTRDIIEDTIIIDGVSFRFIDTAGIRKPKNKIEAMGIEKTYKKINQAKIILYVCDVSECLYDEIKGVVKDFKDHMQDTTKRWILIGNKVDKLVSTPKDFRELVDLETIFVSAKRRENIHMLTSSLRQSVDEGQITDQTLVSNTRHYEALKKSLESLENVEQGFHDDIPTDLITIDLKQALHYLGQITGEITTDEILGNIFGRFCIGK